MAPLTLEVPGRQWSIASRCPAAWQQQIERFGGGYYHSPIGVAACGIWGDPVFFEWRDGAKVLGIAAGVQHGCRLSGSPRHVYLPTLPAVLWLWERPAAMSALIKLLHHHNMAEVTCDSLHAQGLPGTALRPDEIRRRLEYVVRLDQPPEEVVKRWSDGRRAQLRSTAGAGWTLTMPLGEAAADAVAAVRRDAGPPPVRQADDRFGGAPLLDLALGSSDLTRPWGRAVFAAWEGATPLAFAVVAWANRRAYHVMGAATRAGRQRPATTWLHWRIIGELYRHGFTSYGLGGARASAIEASDEVHGLHCYRMGLGAEVVACAGARWVLDPAHDSEHRNPMRTMWECAV